MILPVKSAREGRQAVEFIDVALHNGKIPPNHSWQVSDFPHSILRVFMVCSAREAAGVPSPAPALAGYLLFPGILGPKSLGTAARGAVVALGGLVPKARPPMVMR